MAARLKNYHQEDVKRKIQASVLVNLLQDDALGKVTITDGRRQSAKILLDKSISNAATAIEAAYDGKLEITHKIA